MRCASKIYHICRLNTVSEMLVLHKRDACGKRGAKSVRHDSMIPCVVYGNGKSCNYAVDYKIMYKELQTGGIMTRTFHIKLDDGTEATAMIKEVQFHKVNDKPLHIDFMSVNGDSVIEVNIPIVFLNHHKAPGLRAGGKIDFLVNFIRMRLAHSSMPERFEVDLGDMNIEQQVCIKDLDLPVGSTLLSHSMNKCVVQMLDSKKAPIKEVKGE
jgi:large subunit ribosomal protein L25